MPGIAQRWIGRTGGLVAFLALLAPGVASAQALDWHPDLGQPPQQLSAAGSNSSDPQVAVSDSGAAVAVWARDQGSETLVQAAFRPPGGNFGPPQDIPFSFGSGSLGFFDLAMNARGDAAVTWSESAGTGPGGQPLYLVSAAYKTADQGAFDNAEQISSFTPFPGSRVAIDAQGNALAIWTPSAGRVNGVFHARGGVWTNETVCSTSPCPTPQDLAMNGQGEAVAVFGDGGHVFAAVRPPGAAGRFGAVQDISGSAYPRNCPAQVASSATGAAVAVWVGYSGGADACEPDENSTVQVRGAYRPAGQAFGSPRAISGPSTPDPRTLAHVVRVAMDAQGNAVVASQRDYFDQGDDIYAYTMPAGGWFGSAQSLASTQPYSSTEAEVLDLGNVAMSNGGALVAWSADNRNSQDPFYSRVDTAFRPAGGSFAPAGTLPLPSDRASEPFVAFGANGDGAAVWTKFDTASLSDVIQGRLIIPAGAPPPPPPPPPPPDTSKIRIANKVEGGGPIVLTAAVTGTVDRLEWDLPGRPDAVVGQVVGGTLQRSVRFRPEAGSSFKVSVRAVGPGGTDTFGRSIKLPAAGGGGGDAAHTVSVALDRQPEVYAAGFEDALIGGGSKANRRAGGGGCGATTLYSGTLELKGCMSPVDAIGQIPGRELGVVDTLASRLGLPRNDGDLMRTAVALSDGYMSGGATDIGAGWPVIPRGGASVLAYPQVQALTSSDAALRVGGVDFSPANGFNLKLKAKNGAIPLTALPRPPSLPKIAGLDLVGDLDVKLVGGEAVIKARLKLPPAITKAGVDVQSSVTLRATPTEFIVDGATIGPINADVGAVKVREFRIDCAPCGTATGSWNGQGKVVVLGGLGLDMVPPRGGVAITDGKLTKLGVGVDFPAPGVPISDNVFIESINGGFGLDPTRFFAGTTVRAYQLVTINGQLVFAFPSAATPFILDANEVGHGFASNLYGPPGFTRPTVGVAGTASLNLPLIGGQPMSNAYMLYEYPGYVAIGGGVHLHLSVRGITIERLDIGLSGEGDFDRGVYNFHGDANACIIFLCGAVVVNTSNVGFAACITEGAFGETISQGIEIMWSGRITPWPIDGCKWSRTFVQVRPAGRAVTAARQAAPGTYAVQVKQGDRSQVIQIDGDTGAPRVRVQGPDGQVLESTDGDGQAMTPDGSIRTLSFNEAKITSVGLQDPRPGTYTIEPVEGSAAITQIGRAEDPPAAKVSGKVTGGGDQRTLEYDIRPRPDQRVTFYDVTVDGAEKQIGTVKGGGRGTLRFAPAPGRGKHQIVAQFALAEMAAEREVVTSFKPPSPKLPRPKRLRVERSAKPLSVSWERVPGAASYEIAVTTSTGAQHFITTRKTKKVITGVPKSSAGRVSVRAVARLRDGNPSVDGFKRTAPRRTSLESLPRCKLSRHKLKCKRGG